MATISDTAIGGLLQWTFDFSEGLDPKKQIEMRMRVLQFAGQAFPARDPGFDLDDLAAGRHPAGAPTHVSLAVVIQAFRYYQEKGDADRGITAAQLVWHMVGIQRIAALN